MTAPFSWIFLAVLAAFGSNEALAVLCHQCLNVSSYTRCFQDCMGDFCFLNSGPTSVTQGCIQGVPDLQSGCWHNENQNSTLCLCSEHTCNDPNRLPADFQKATQPTTISCQDHHSYTSKSSACTGKTCFFHRETYSPVAPEPPTLLESGSCKPQNLGIRPVFYELLSQLGEPLLPERSCYEMQDRPESHVLECNCRTENCNKQALTDLVATGHMVQCHMIPSAFEVNQQLNETCLGQYCFLKRATIHSEEEGLDFVSYRKGCFNISGDPKYMKVGHRQFDQGTQTEETWFCNQDYCNFDMNRADISIAKYEANMRTTTIAKTTTQKTTTTKVARATRVRSTTQRYSYETTTQYWASNNEAVWGEYQTTTERQNIVNLNVVPPLNKSSDFVRCSHLIVLLTTVSYIVVL